MLRAIVFAVLFAACATDDVGDIGAVEKVEMPATARIGEPVTVTITTTGGGCIRPSSTIVVTTPEATTITPYDDYPDGAACTRELARVIHTAVLRFDRVGTAYVRVHTSMADDIQRRIVVAY